MEKTIVSVSLCMIGLLAVAQTNKKSPAKNVSTPVQPLKTSIDSFSYAIALSIAKFYKEQGVKNINNDLVLRALNDLKKGKPLLNDEQTNTCIMSFMQKAQEEKASGNKKAGEAFLAENKMKEGVVTLPSGLQYIVIQQGTGPKPTADDKVKVHYHGTLIDGTIFDSSIQRGEPIVFEVKRVIPGWTEALQLMPVGSKYRLFIPSSLAYGDNQSGPEIKPGSTLIFDVELLDIVK